MWEAAHQFELGHILNSAITDALEPSEVGKIGAHHAGLWECDLADDSLVWSGGVYDIFGLPRGAHIDRNQTLALYAEASRSAVERLRAYAIKHRRGFTIDVEICPVAGDTRWMRLIAAPECNGNRVTRLHGLKLAI
jgi:PAS domain-containing protein